MRTTTKIVNMLLIGLTMSSCEKSGNSFSVLSGSSSFQQAATFEPRKLDVLFVIDNSGSMSSSQQNQMCIRDSLLRPSAELIGIKWSCKRNG